MRILAYPAFGPRELNPYTRLLYKHMKADVFDFSYRRAFTGRFDVFHIHWPEWEANFYRNPVEAALRLRLKIAVIDVLRLRGTRLIWTAHNLKAHDGRHPAVERRFWRAFIKRLDGYIALTAAGREAACETFPELTNKPSFVIPHGHYRDHYPCTSTVDARAELGIGSKSQVLLFFGRIRNYKNLPLLIESFSRLTGDVTLCIAGCPDSADVTRKITTLATHDSRIHLHLRDIADDRVQHFFRAADLVVLPYREILNSGTAMLALSFARPVLVPDLGAMSELRCMFGAEWVRAYSGPLTPLHLAESLNWARTSSRSLRPALELVDWSTLAKQTLHAYSEIVGGVNGTRDPYRTVRSASEPARFISVDGTQ